MTQEIEQHTLVEMVQSFAAYLPTGPLFEAAHIQGSNFFNLLLGLSGQLLQAENFLFVYNSEFLPTVPTSFIEEWESMLGIPDSCFPGSSESNREIRRLHILVKLASLGVQTDADFINLATILGFPSTTVESGIGLELIATLSGTNWTDNSDGTYTHTVGSTSSLTQAASLIIDQDYFYTTIVTGRTAGSITPRFTGGTTVTGAAILSNGTNEQILTTVTGNTTIDLLPTSDFDGTVELSVRSDTAVSGSKLNSRFTIVVGFLALPENIFPLNFPIPFGNEQYGILECLFTKLKPANCAIVFTFI